MSRRPSSSLPSWTSTIASGAAIAANGRSPLDRAGTPPT